MTSYYIDKSNLLSQRENDRQLERHRKRLEEISSRKKKAKLNQEIEIGMRLNENKKLIHDFQISKKREEIDKDNQLLLKRLVEIQAGKHVKFIYGLNFCIQSQLPKSQSQSVFKEDTRAKSLHIVKRKLELERIERENMKIAQKIMSLKPEVLVSQFEQEFSMHKKYGQSIRRLQKRRLPQVGGKVGALPPLDASNEIPEGHSTAGSLVNTQGVSQSMEVKNTESLGKNQKRSEKVRNSDLTVQLSQRPNHQESQLQSSRKGQSKSSTSRKTEQKSHKKEGSMMSLQDQPAQEQKQEEVVVDQEIEKKEFVVNETKEGGDEVRVEETQS